MNTIEKIINVLKSGGMVVVTDDERRENEGDLISLAQYSSAQTVAFMAKEARGLVCTPLSREIAEKLHLHPMVEQNTDNHETAFTVSVDYKTTSTGISAADRMATIASFLEESTQPLDLRRPGHVFPLIAKDGGVRERAGHTEAAIDLARLCGAKEVAIICEIMGDDGVMLTGDKLDDFAKKHQLYQLTIIELQAYLKEMDYKGEEIKW